MDPPAPAHARVRLPGGICFSAPFVCVELWSPQGVSWSMTPLASRALAIAVVMIAYFVGLKAGGGRSCAGNAKEAPQLAPVAQVPSVASAAPGPLPGYLKKRFVPPPPPSPEPEKPLEKTEVASPSPSVSPSAFNARLSDRCVVNRYDDATIRHTPVGSSALHLPRQRARSSPAPAGGS